MSKDERRKYIGSHALPYVWNWSVIQLHTPKFKLIILNFHVRCLYISIALPLI